MAKDETFEERYEAPPDRVWEALEQAVAGLKYEVRERDGASRLLEFNTGLSLWSWSGQDLEARVMDEGQGTTRLVLTGKIARRGLSSFQVVSWGEKGRVARKVLARVGEQLGAGAPAA